MHVFGAEVFGLAAHVFHQLRTVDALRETGEVLHQARERKLPSGFVSGNDERFQIGAGSVDGGRVSRAHPTPQ